MNSLRSIACLLFFVNVLLGDSQRLSAEENPPRFAVEMPQTVLQDVPVPYVTIRALTPKGETDTSFNERIDIQGLRQTWNGMKGALPEFKNGVLALKTDLASGYRVWVDTETLSVSRPDDNDGEGEPIATVTLTPGWMSLLPPLLAILLAIWWREVLLALLAAIWAGVTVIEHGDAWTALLRMLDTWILRELQDADHLLIILFTFLLGAMVSVMTRGGGTAALINKMSGISTQREHAQMMTSGLGFVVFFDDYANTLMVGGTMRPMTDRLGISREKLAFLVDSTAAPIAGLAMISTWVGVEIQYISDTYASLGLSRDVYGVFLATIPYRFYPVLLLAFVWMIAATGRDFGPMRTAEVRAASAAGAHSETTQLEEKREHKKEWMMCALIPLGVLILAIIIGLWWTGTNGLTATNADRIAAGEAAIETSLWTVLNESSSTSVLYFAAFFAALSAVFLVWGTGSLNLQQTMSAWGNGMKEMLPAIQVLVLAWTISTLCKPENLNTAGYLVEQTSDLLSVGWMPTLAFLLAAATAFATGSSWSTMGLLMPLFISLTYYLLVEQTGTPAGIETAPVMLASIGAVLAGAIFGDHCSPISDTTILSSAAAGCDHFSHVSTQMPYALVVGGVSLLFGYLPAGFLGGWVWVVLLLGLLALFLIVKTVGKPLPENLLPSTETT